MLCCIGIGRDVQRLHASLDEQRDRLGMLVGELAAEAARATEMAATSLRASLRSIEEAVPTLGRRVEMMERHIRTTFPAELQGRFTAIAEDLRSGAFAQTRSRLFQCLSDKDYVGQGRRASSRVWRPCCEQRLPLESRVSGN